MSKLLLLFFYRISHETNFPQKHLGKHCFNICCVCNFSNPAYLLVSKEHCDAYKRKERCCNHSSYNLFAPTHFTELLYPLILSDIQTLHIVLLIILSLISIFKSYYSFKNSHLKTCIFYDPACMTLGLLN